MPVASSATAAAPVVTAAVGMETAAAQMAAAVDHMDKVAAGSAKQEASTGMLAGEMAQGRLESQRRRRFLGRSRNLQLRAQNLKPWGCGSTRQRRRQTCQRLHC